MFFSQTPAVLVNLDGAPIWSPIGGTDLRFVVNTNWDLFEYPESHSYYLRVDKSWLTASSLDGPWTAARSGSPQLSKPARRRQLEGRQGGVADRRGHGEPRAEGLHQQHAGGTAAHGRRAEVPAGDGNQPLLGEQHRRRRLPARAEWPRLLPRVGPLVLGARLHRTVDVRHAEPAGRLQAHSRDPSAIARARVGARHEAGARGGAARCRFRRPRGDRAGVQAADGRLCRGRRSSSRSSRPACRARSTPTRTFSRSATCITCASTASGSVARRRRGHGRSPTPFPKRHLRDPDQLAGVQRHLRDRRRLPTTTRWSTRPRRPTPA